jgi:hypothetical protein
MTIGEFRAISDISYHAFSEVYGYLELLTADRLGFTIKMVAEERFS